MLARTGARSGEAQGWRWGDLGRDDHGDYIWVCRSVRDGRVGPVKSRTSRRRVPLSPAAVRELAAHRLASPWSGEDDPSSPPRTGAR
jgi:integrase